MGKYKIGQNRTFLDGMFPQAFPHAEKGGETNSEKPREDHITEPQKRVLDKIWSWLDSPCDD